jgi:hypothetical protein
MDADDEVELAAATRHARSTLFPATAGRRCIDGRYEPGQGSGLIARPGADFGYVMALLSLNHALRWGLTPAQVVDAVWRVVAGEGGPFRIHTDQLVAWPPWDGAARDTDGVTGRPVIGCRHVAAAADPARATCYFPPSYPSPDVDVRAALDRIAARARDGEAVDVIRLRGQRVERGVLVVVGTQRTVQPTTARDAYFVYDQARDEAFVARTLVPGLGLPGLTAAALTAAARVQLAASLRIVAAGRPVFLVDVDGAVPEVVCAGRVEAVFPANLSPS